MNMYDETVLWELFCSTGEPRYYSMYALARDERERREKNDRRN